MKPIKKADRDWQPTGIEGAERCLFHHNQAGGKSSIVRLQAGTRFPAHRHESDEDVLVLQGSVEIGGHELHAGDFLLTTAGETHAVAALSDAIIYVSSQSPTPMIEQENANG